MAPWVFDHENGRDIPAGHRTANKNISRFSAEVRPAAGCDPPVQVLTLTGFPDSTKSRGIMEVCSIAAHLEPDPIMRHAKGRKVGKRPSGRSRKKPRLTPSWELAKCSNRIKPKIPKAACRVEYGSLTAVKKMAPHGVLENIWRTVRRIPLPLALSPLRAGLTSVRHADPCEHEFIYVWMGGSVSHWV